MLLDPELEKLAVANRQRLTREFAEKYANLRERARRVPMAEAKQIAEKLSCPLQIAIVAYLINLDGILKIRDAVDIFTLELRRRAVLGETIPNLPGNIMEFALNEGRWIEYCYGSFVRELEMKIRELSNLESALEEEDIPIEKAISIISTRNRLAETFVAPIVKAWLEEHPKSTSEDFLMSIGPAVTKWPRNTLKGKLNPLVRRNQALFRRLRKFLVGASESATIDASIRRLDRLIEHLSSGLNKLSISATAHLLIHIAPRPVGRGDRSTYIEFGTASTRGGKAEPDMASPFDFLERDVQLAKRRSENERADYLTERISRVLSVLKYQGTPVLESIEKCMRELEDRLSLGAVPFSEIISRVEEEISSASIEERDTVAIRVVYDYITKYAYGSGV